VINNTSENAHSGYLDLYKLVQGLDKEMSFESHGRSMVAISLVQCVVEILKYVFK